MASPLDAITDKHTDEHQLLLAIRQLGPPTEPPGFWINIANNDEFPTHHRRSAVFQLFARHLTPGMKLSGLADMLNGSEWLEDHDIRMVEDLSGYIPVKLTHDNTVFVVRVLPALLPDEYWAIYLRVSALIELDSFLRLLHGEEVAEKTKDAVILEIAFSPMEAVGKQG